METRELGKNGFQVPVVIFGAWAAGGWKWGGADDQQTIRAIHAAGDHGITCIDTAPVYGFGRSENVVGRAIKGRRDSFLIFTKCGLRWDDTRGDFHFKTQCPLTGRPLDIYRYLSKASIIAECEASLTRLGIDCIDLYQCHWPDKTTPLEETMTALTELKRQGKIRAIGVSNFTVEQIDTARGIVPLISDQPKYSLIERKIELNILPYAVKHQLGVIVYSPLGQGLLTGKVTMDRTFPEDDLRSMSDWFKPHNRRRVLDALERIQCVADQHGVTLANVTARWALQKKGVTSVIIGARSSNQAAENARVGAFCLSADEMALIETAFADVKHPL